MSCCGRETFMEQFHLSNCWLTNVDPTSFIKSQWKRQPTVGYAIYRWVVAVLFVVWLGIDYWKTTEMFYDDHWLTWLIYATNWSLTGLLTVAWYHAIICTYYLVYPERLTTGGGDIDEKDVDPSRRVPGSVMTFWCLYASFCNLAIVVSVCFWTFILFLDHGVQYDAPISKVKHTLNTVYVIIDLLITANPVRIFHVIYPLIAMTIYIIFDTIYIAAGGRGEEGRNFIYQELRWNDPIEALVTLTLTFILVFASQLVLFSSYEIRALIFSKVVEDGRDSTPLLTKMAPSSDDNELKSNNYKSTDKTDLLTAESPVDATN